MIVIPNEKLLAVAKDRGFLNRFACRRRVRRACRALRIITIPGIINRDFADVKTTMAGMGYAVMGTAVAAAPTVPLKQPRRHVVAATQSVQLT